MDTTNTPTIENRYREFMNAVGTLTKIEQAMTLELDGKNLQSKCTPDSILNMDEMYRDATDRNLFPKATADQRKALAELDVIRHAATKLDPEKILNGDEQELQHAYEAFKARVRALFPLDEVNPLQRYYLETVLLK